MHRNEVKTEDEEQFTPSESTGQFLQKHHFSLERFKQEVIGPLRRWAHHSKKLQSPESSEELERDLEFICGAIQVLGHERLLDLIWSERSRLFRKENGHHGSTPDMQAAEFLRVIGLMSARPDARERFHQALFSRGTHK